MLVAEDLAPADTAGLDPALVLALVTERGGPTSHTAIIARQLGIPCVVGIGAAPWTIAGGTPRCSSTARPAPSSSTPTPADGRRARSRRRASAGPRWPLVRARRAPPTAPRSRSWPTSPTASPPAPRPQAPVEGVGLFRTELCFLNRKEEPTVEEQADIYAEVLDAFARRTARAVRRGPHPRRRLRQAGRVRDPRRARRTPPSACAGCGCPSTTPACSSASSTRSPRPRASTGTETWVMAPMVATVAEAGEFAGEGAASAGSRPG